LWDVLVVRQPRVDDRNHRTFLTPRDFSVFSVDASEVVTFVARVAEISDAMHGCCFDVRS
jgi:hypothetical protein